MAVLESPNGNQLVVEVWESNDCRVRLIYRESDDEHRVWYDAEGQGQIYYAQSLIDSVKWKDDDSFSFESKWNRTRYSASRGSLGRWEVTLQELEEPFDMEELRKVIGTK